VTNDAILSNQVDHWDRLARLHGATFRATDWPSPERVELVFRQLAAIWGDGRPGTVLDFGCGYGALLEHLRANGFDVTAYHGHDVSAEMLAHARERSRDALSATFSGDPDQLEAADYVFAAGVFNEKLETDATVWRDYVVHTIDRLWSLTRRGLAFDILTSYSDPDRMRPDLFYADPCWFFDYCKRHLS
jgi:SAM-dependent methyltransferase